MSALPARLGPAVLLLGVACGRGPMQVPRPTADASAGADADAAAGSDGNVVMADGAVADLRPADTAQPDGWPEVRSSCGNGRYDQGEECDDGNRLSGDGCSVSCQLECGDAGVEPCIDPGFFPQSPWSLCCAPRRVDLCGDGRRTQGEACDDGNVLAGDGCASDCGTVEPGYRCTMPGTRCTPVCGDGVRVGGETCDDGNRDGGDGCSSFCLVEPGPYFCGDGIVSGAEECDAGPDNGSEDGACSAQCAYLYCGDGVVSPGEACDQGAQNRAGYGTQGGCTLACTPSHYCGDGMVDTEYGESCDLGERNGQSICTLGCATLAVP